MRETVTEIRTALSRCKPVMLIGKPGTGQITDSKDALEDLGLSPMHLFLPAMSKLFEELPIVGEGRDAKVLPCSSPEARKVHEADSFILDELDEAGRELQDDVRHFLAVSSRPVVVIVHDEAKVPEDVKALCTVIRRAC